MGAKLWGSLLAAAAALTLSGGAPQGGGAPARAQDSDARREQREKRAQELWDAALQLEKEGKFAEAQAKLRELRSRYRSTHVYRHHLIDIIDKLNELGQRLAVGFLGKTAPSKRAHVDSWYGYEFTPPESWKGVPPLAQWFGDQDSSETLYRGRTYRIARYTAPYLEKLYLEVYKTFDCSNLEDLDTRATSTLEGQFKGLREEQRSQSAGRMPYVRKVFTSAAGDRVVAYYYYAERVGLMLAGIWRAGGEESIFVRVTTVTSQGTSSRKTKELPVDAKDFGEALKIFDQTAKTFRIYDQATRQGKRTQMDRGALCADWNIMKSPRGNYIIEYATRPEFAKRVGEEMEQILALYKQIIPTQKAIPPCRIKVFDREEDFQYYSFAYGAAAYWSPGQEEIVCYRFEGDKLRSRETEEEFEIAEERNPEDVTIKVLYHEGFHQYMYFYMGRDRGVYVPSWMNEGLGDYFFGGEWSADRRKFTIGINDWRIRTILSAIRKNEHVPISQIIRYEQAQYYANPGLCYAEGWALNYFFQQSDVARRKGYHLLPRRMLEELKTSADWEKATQKVFGGLDLKKMEEEWKEFMLSLPIAKELEKKEQEKGGEKPREPEKKQAR
jgi:hypothetical protein